MSKTQNRRDAPTSEFGEAYDSEVGEKKSLTNMVLDQLLSDVPQRDLLTVEPSTSITETVRRMNQRRLGYALIVEAGKLTGIFTERDVLTQITKVFRAQIQALSDEKMPIPWIEPPEKAGPGETERFVPIHL